MKFQRNCRHNRHRTKPSANPSKTVFVAIEYREQSLSFIEFSSLEQSILPCASKLLRSIFAYWSVGSMGERTCPCFSKLLIGFFLKVKPIKPSHLHYSSRLNLL
ncbi:hypothetical protein SOVF_128790 [Spinacia oleracea]|nr:hypothetical protein SOVF_128790 [Spinacia oleracea]